LRSAGESLCIIIAAFSVLPPLVRVRRALVQRCITVISVDRAAVLRW
jgi:hypothetical protein